MNKGPFSNKNSFSIKLTCPNCGGINSCSENDILYPLIAYRIESFDDFRVICKICEYLLRGPATSIPRMVSNRIRENVKQIIFLCDKCNKVHFLYNTEPSSSSGRNCCSIFTRIFHPNSRICNCKCGEENFIFIWYLPRVIQESLENGFVKI